MPRPRKEPEYTYCQWCGSSLPEGRRADMKFCPQPDDPWTSNHSNATVRLPNSDFRGIGRPATPIPPLAEGTDPSPGEKAWQVDPKGMTNEPFRDSAPQSCKDAYWNAARGQPVAAWTLVPIEANDMTRWVNRPSKDDLRYGPITSQFGPKPAVEPPLKFAERVTDTILASIGRIIRQQPEYAATIAMQTADDDVLDATVANAAAIHGVVESERLRVWAEAMRDQGKRLDTLRDFQRVAHQYDAPPTGPAPTGQRCSNCQQPDTDHLPGCARASGEDPEATTDGALSPTA